MTARELIQKLEYEIESNGHSDIEVRVNDREVGTVKYEIEYGTDIQFIVNIQSK
ncbi:MAG: hypothetical protein H7A23_20120 [Leptospiraceae bacterium]|nr:hypothetical protein [Leptospiraceae bacterium]